MRGNMTTYVGEDALFLIWIKSQLGQPWNPYGVSKKTCYVIGSDSHHGAIGPQRVDELLANLCDSGYLKTDIVWKEFYYNPTDKTIPEPQITL